MLAGMAHLLIVEDDELLRDALSAQLKLAGHTVTPAADGVQAQSISEARVDADLQRLIATHMRLLHA